MAVKDYSDPYTFAARSFDWRLHCGSEAIENRLKEEVIRLGAKRAFAICSPSIASKTNSMQRIKDTLGPLWAGEFTGIEIDSTYASTKAAADAAREAGADLLIAVGGGSVLVAVRVVDVFLCEEGDPFDLMTQYPEGKPAVSPRLNAPKLPIINIPTTPTSAMNRGGSGLANPDLDHRMEYFDPKTRPAALIFDHEAIMASPVELMRSTATQIFSGAIMGAAETKMNPLVEADRTHILRLAKRSYLAMIESPDAIGPRIDLFVAALLANRASDDATQGIQERGGRTFAGNYALSTAMHVRYAHVWQGEAGTVLAATMVRRSPVPDEEPARRIAQELDVYRDGMSAQEMQMAIADGLEEFYAKVGMPTRIRELDIPREDFPILAKETIKVFNANAGMRDPEKQYQDAIEVLEQAY